MEGGKTSTNLGKNPSIDLHYQIKVISYVLGAIIITD